MEAAPASVVTWWKNIGGPQQSSALLAGPISCGWFQKKQGHCHCKSAPTGEERRVNAGYNLMRMQQLPGRVWAHVYELY